MGRRDDNSGVYLRTPGPAVPDALAAADAEGIEVQIDERGFDATTSTEGHPQKITGAFYDLQAPAVLASHPIGFWNALEIECRGPAITVSLNGQRVNAITRNGRSSGYLALQAHHFTSRVQFRNVRVKRL